MPRKRKRQTEIGLSSILTASEKRQFLDYLKSKATTLQGRKRFLIIDILLNSGLRASELCALRLKDLPGVVGGNVIEVIFGKNNKDRSVPISQRLADAIEDYIQHDRSKTIPRYIRRKDPAGFLFYNQCKRKTKYNALYRMIRRAGERAGVVKRIRPHVLRHTFATNAIKKMPINDLSERLGHSDISITGRYLHVVDDQHFALAEALDQT